MASNPRLFSATERRTADLASRKLSRRQNDDGAASGIGTRPQQFQRADPVNRKDRAKQVARFIEEATRLHGSAQKQYDTVDSPVALFQLQSSRYGLSIMRCRLGLHAVLPSVAPDHTIPRSPVAGNRKRRFDRPPKGSVEHPPEVVEQRNMSGVTDWLARGVRLEGQLEPDYCVQSRQIMHRYTPNEPALDLADL